MRIRRITLGIAAGALALPLVAGCGQAAEQAAEQAIEQAVPSMDVDLEEGSITVEDEQGNTTAAGESVALPDNWPGDVPALATGTLMLVSVNEADGTAFATWTITDPVDQTVADYQQALTDAGYTVETTMNAAEMSAFSAVGNGHKVDVVAGSAQDQASVSVTVSPSE